jgi:hypothetical protein
MALAISLGELLSLSEHTAVGTSVDAFSQWEMVAKRRRIVTYSVVDIERPLDGKAVGKGPLMVRTLGGLVGDLGQIVHGEAVLALGERTALFLHHAAPDFFSVVAMAQGAYPVKPDEKGVHRLRAAAQSLELSNVADAAVRRLDGNTLPSVEAMIAEELTRGSR